SQERRLYSALCLSRWLAADQDPRRQAGTACRARADRGDSVRRQLCADSRGVAAPFPRRLARGLAAGLSAGIPATVGRLPVVLGGGIQDGVDRGQPLFAARLAPFARSASPMLGGKAGLGYAGAKGRQYAGAEQWIAG